MKKIVILTILALGITSGYAQKGNVSKAKNKALMENPDFAGARELIKPALENPQTMNDANTWYVAGTIGYKENDAELNKQMLGQKFDPEVKGKALLESYDYFLKAYEVDGQPDAKGRVRPRFQRDIKVKIKEYFTQQANLVAYGAHLFEKKDYKGAVNAFEIYLGIPKLPMMNNELSTNDSTYRMIKYYTAIACTNGEMNDKAITLYEELKDEGYEELVVHQLLHEEYKNKKDTANFVRVLKAGFEKFPQEAWFLQNLINYYIYTNQSQEALVYLNSAIEREPGLAQYRFVKGNLDESLGNFDEAEASFKKALEIDPNLAEAHAGMGRLIFNKAVRHMDAINDIKDIKTYNAEKRKGDDIFKQAIPYFIKAKELKPEEMDYKRTLRTLYYRLQMDKEFEAIEKEMNM